MSLADVVNQAKQDKGIALMTHIIVGYPSIEANWEILDAFEESGVDVVELQFPFSEPIADGPLFALANQVSIDLGTDLDRCFDIMRQVTQKYSFKVVVVAYYNTAFKLGEQQFCQRLAEAGASGMIIPDLPVEEAKEFQAEAIKNHLEWIPLVAPTNTLDRLLEISQSVQSSQGFVYAVARKGVTGRETSFDELNVEYFDNLTQAFKIPIGVGFGISKPEHIQMLKDKVSLAVIGTAVLKEYEQTGQAGVVQLLKSLR